MQKRSIHNISSVSGIGGAEHSLIELAGHLDRERFQPYLMAGEGGPLVERFRELDIPVILGEFPWFSRRKPWVYWQAVWRIAQVMRDKEIALAHVNCDRAVPHSVLAGALTRRPVLCHVHDMTRAWYQPRYVRYLNRCARIIADSEATASHCRQAGMLEDKIQVIYECFEMERYKNVSLEERQQVRSEWSIPPGSTAIGLVGQVLRHKGHEEFIRAAGLVVQECPDARFLVVGDDRLSVKPGFLPFLRRLARDLNIERQVIFAGYRTDIPQVMAALDVVTVPSWEEPFGRVVVEALAVQRPVIGSDSGGIPEILEDGKTGLLVPPRQPQALAQAMLRLCQDSGLRQTMGVRGPGSAARFDILPHTRKFETLYTKLIQNCK